MAEDHIYIGLRRSYGGALCTVRYYGPLTGTKGEWLGVEWDDPSRGKHDGKHEGEQIFTCLSSISTAASFVRPSRRPDPERTLLEAIRFKYARPKSTDIETPDDAASATISISGKVVEEVGFEKIQKQLSILAELRIVLVDELVVSGVAQRNAPTQEIEDAQEELTKTCPSIVELDVGWNVMETWRDVVDMCRPFKKLKILKTSGLRLNDFAPERFAKKTQVFRHVEELHLSECLLRPHQLMWILSSAGAVDFPNLKTLRLLSNDLDTFDLVAKKNLNFPSVTTLVFDNNKFTSLASLPNILTIFPNATTLSFQENSVSRIGLDTLPSKKPYVFQKVETLKLTGNQIGDYGFVNTLPTIFPNLTSLRISRNPLYDQVYAAGPEDQSLDSSKQPERGPQSAGAQSDSTSYYLTLARIPNLLLLNYTTITARDREEGEIYYISVVEKEIRTLLEDEDQLHHSDGPSSVSVLEKITNTIREKHPLYNSLCIKYDRDDLLDHHARQLIQSAKGTATGEESIPGAKAKLETYAPGTLGSRLVDAVFYIPKGLAQEHRTRSFHRPLPTTISVYRLKSLVARSFPLPPLQFKLVYESHEYDPVEPISRNTGANAAGGSRNEKADWDAWGDWDVDSSDSGDGGDVDRTGADVETTDSSESMFIVRDGQRFKKRETEILDGMRAWGDFLDVDGSPLVVAAHAADARGKALRQVRIRVEPFRRDLN